MAAAEGRIQRLSHKKFRALLKKEKRKRKRQAAAKQRDEELVCEDEVEEAEEPGEEELEAERERLHLEWLEKEKKAQEEFQLKKEKEAAAQKRQEEEERKIREEWEQQQMREKEEVEHKRQERRERESIHHSFLLIHQDEAVQKMLDQAESQIENGGMWHNPEAPEDYGTEKDKSYCPFFLKTGSCRFGDRCSRKHVYPASSQTLLIRAMFITFGMEESRRDDYDTDSGLEHSEEDIYQQFIDFYEDVLPEFKSIGKVIQFKVSCNYEPHLRGNVYVQYEKEEECQQAFALFNGRWYAGKQLQCEFSPVTRWKTAICGLYERRKCPRGKHCNFLHVFRNPNSEFWEADRDLCMSPERRKFHSERRERMSHRYDNHIGSRRKYSCSPDKKQRRSGEPERKRKRSRSRDKKWLQRSRSRSQDRKRSRSRERYCRSWSKEVRKSQRSRSRSQDRRKSKSRERCRYRSRSRNLDQSLSRSRSRSRSNSQDQSNIKDPETERSRSRSQSPYHGWNKKSKGESESKEKRSKKKAKKGKKNKNKSENKSKYSKTKRLECDDRHLPASSIAKDTQVTLDHPDLRSFSTSPSAKSSGSDTTAPAKLDETIEAEAVDE